MTTALATINQAKRWLLTGQREALNKLNGALLSSGTSVVVEFDLGAIQTGSKISVDLEDMYVWSVTDSTNTATVERGQFGSTAATHADDSLVYVNPKFSNFELFTELNNELASLSTQLFQPKTLSLIYNPSYTAYNLTSVTSIDDILALSYETLDTSREYIPLTNVRFQRNLPTADFASGFALTLLEPADPGQTIQVVYRAPFTAVTALADDLTTVAGLPSTAVDVVAMGVAIRMSASREIRRNFNEEQGDTRRADEVPAGANNQAPAGLRQQYQMRLQQEMQKQRRHYPVRRP